MQIMSASTKKPAGRSRPAAPKDAIALLRADHRKVSTLFAEYARSDAPPRKKALVKEICTELSVHAQIEEELFYPAAKLAMGDHELIPEALVEHASLRALIAAVENTEPGGEDFEARMQVLGEYVTHHVREEQNEMFPKAKATSLDLTELGARLAERKAVLLASRQ
jgi:hemerythrin superfamily protein